MPARSELAVDDAIAACAAGWSDHAARTRAAAQLGLAIDDETARKLQTWLDAANERRRLYTMPLADLLRALVEARDGEIAVRHGGKGGPHAMTPTSIALAVRIDNEVVVAIGQSTARAASPGVAWKTLAPWQADLAKNVARARAWIPTEPLAIRVPIVEKTQAEVRQSRVTRDAVLQEVLARPHEDEPRLVYADALTARGDPRGEFIVVQCALAAGSTDPKLVKRETALRREHGAAWMKEAKQLARACSMRRGFVASVTMSARQFAKAGKLFDREPIEELVIVEPEPRSLAALAPLPHLARLDRIVFEKRAWIGNPGVLRAFQTFLRALGTQRHLHIGAASFQDVDASGLFDDIAWPRVETLALDIRIAQPIAPSVCRMHLPKLRELALSPLGETRELSAAFPAAAIKAL